MERQAVSSSYGGHGLRNQLRLPAAGAADGGKPTLLSQKITWNKVRKADLRVQGSFYGIRLK